MEHFSNFLEEYTPMWRSHERFDNYKLTRSLQSDLTMCQSLSSLILSWLNFILTCYRWTAGVTPQLCNSQTKLCDTFFRFDHFVQLTFIIKS